LSYIRLPDIKNIKVFIIGNFNFDDFTYTLITVNGTKIKASKAIGFADEYDSRNYPQQLTTFEVGSDYIFKITTKKKREDNWSISKEEKIKIDENGLLVGVK
jgi:hypothetical protein